MLGNSNWKERLELSLFTDGMIYVENPKDSIKKLIRINKLSEVARFKINI